MRCMSGRDEGKRASPDFFELQISPSLTIGSSAQANANSRPDGLDVTFSNRNDNKNNVRLGASFKDEKTYRCKLKMTHKEQAAIHSILTLLWEVQLPLGLKQSYINLSSICLNADSCFQTNLSPSWARFCLVATACSPNILPVSVCLKWGAGDQNPSFGCSFPGCAVGI